jgi:hypothetical protein
MRAATEPLWPPLLHVGRSYQFCGPLCSIALPDHHHEAVIAADHPGRIFGFCQSLLQFIDLKALRIDDSLEFSNPSLGMSATALASILPGSHSRTRRIEEADHFAAKNTGMITRLSRLPTLSRLRKFPRKAIYLSAR